MAELTKTQFESLFSDNERPKVSTIESSTDKITVSVLVPKGLAWFEGHFPDQKVLPGVVQVDWVVKLTKSFFMQAEQFSELSNIKFKTMVLPDTDLKIELTHKPAKNSVSFHLFNDETSFSQGSLKFKTS